MMQTVTVASWDLLKIWQLVRKYQGCEMSSCVVCLPLSPGNVCRRDMVQSSHGGPPVSREHRINTVTNITQAISVYPSISQYIPVYLRFRLASVL